MKEIDKNQILADEPLDQLMHDAMKGYRVEPPPGLWQGINRKLLWREILRFNFSNVTRTFWMVGGAGMFVAAVVLYVGIKSATTNEPVRETEPAAMNASMQAAEKKPAVNQETIFAGKLQTTTAPAVHKAEKDRGLTASENPHTASASSEPNSFVKHQGEGNSMASLSAVKAESEPVACGQEAVTAMSVSPTASNTQSSGHGAFLPVTMNFGEISMKEISIIPACKGIVNAFPGADTIITIQSAGGTYRFRERTEPVPGFFSARLGVNPEMTFNSGAGQSQSFIYWISGGISYNLSRFSVSSGIGIGYNSVENKYVVDYLSNDSVGYYTSVESFNVGGNNQIIYNTALKNIYDSVLHVADDRSRSRFTYLEIPLLLGYRIIEKPGVCLTLRAGPAVSILVSTRESDTELDYQNVRIIRVEGQPYNPNKTNWQIRTGLDLEVRMNRNWSFYVESSWKYYFDQIISNEGLNNKNSWSLSLGAGLQYNFGKK